ncbi:hypothetical protein [sulfur-oxidizing endosymbiont of Gigantopelta aegis]|uniref:hypothetical protein n=1 Tax=sulfur-oxidizing endosymbiont of Gigantopelta aegis TaxID=2794934 RepID=UPI0018DCCFA0|nr:hypothetical protein [sulfur-oxidizing endosymbiont of Gigantopelta aegis]
MNDAALERLTDKNLLPSPAGAYYCVSSSDNEPARLFLQQLMDGNESLTFDSDTLADIFKDMSGLQDEVIYHLQKLNFLQQFEQKQSIKEGTIEDSLPDLLKQLSSDKKALLADGQGFYLASHGFTHEASEELSAMSGDFVTLYSRHQGIIKGNLNIHSGAFALVDAGGYSQLGFWPIYIGELVFMLVISGVPRFDQQAFVDLVWHLHKRYYSYQSPTENNN